MMFLCFIILYSFLMYGFSNLLVNGMGPYNCLDKFRSICHKHIPMVGEMLECMMCTSTNLGWVLSLTNFLLFPQLTFTPFTFLFHNEITYWYLILAFDALFTTGIVWVIHSFQDMCEKVANYFSNVEEEDE